MTKSLLLLLCVFCAAVLPAQDVPKEQPKARKAAPSTVRFAAESEKELRVIEGSVATLGSETPLKSFRMLVLAKFADGANKYADLDSDATARYRIEFSRNVQQLRVFAYGEFVIPDSWSNVALGTMKFEKTETWDIKVRPNVLVELKGRIKYKPTGAYVDNHCAVFLAPLDVRQDGSMRVFDEPSPTRCDTEGNYAFKKPAGYYRLWAVWTDRAGGRWVFCSAVVQRVDLFGDLTQDLTIEPGPQITGKVIDARSGKGVGSRVDFYTNAYLRQLMNMTSDGEMRDDEAVEGDPVLPEGHFRMRLYNVDTAEFAAIIRPRSAESVLHIERGLSYASLKGKAIEWKLFSPEDAVLTMTVRTADLKLPLYNCDVSIEADRLDDPSISHLRSAIQLRGFTDHEGKARFVGLPPGDYSVYIEQGTELLATVKVTGAATQEAVLDYEVPFATGKLKYPDGSPCNAALCQVEIEMADGQLRGPFSGDPFENKLLKEKGVPLIPLTIKGATFKLQFFANDKGLPAPDDWTSAQFPWKSKVVTFKVETEKAYTFDLALEAAEGSERKAEAGPMKTGEFWYRMQDAKGKATGYARMVVMNEGGGQAVDWTMKIAYTGGSYEEERNLAWDKERRFVRSSYSANGKLVCEGARSEGKVSGRKTVKGKLEDFSVETPDDAMPYMGFLTAATLPLNEGETWTRKELDEANGFADKGVTEFKITRDTVTWEGKELACWRIDVTKPGDAGRKLTLWVSGAREVVQIDWGGSKQILSRDSTEHLFKKPEPAMKETAASSKEWLELECDFEGVTPQTLYDHFTKPELLTRWWPPEAEIEMKVGGKYRAIWKAQNWILEGTVKEFEEGKKFVFTWRWNETPKEAPTLEVHCTFEKTEKGAKLIIKHGPNATDEKGQESRAGYIAGWQQFIAALKEELKK